MEKGAILSEDRKYRYVLWREWDASLPKLMFVGLNPSTADENEDDPTIKKCIAFAEKWGYGGFYMTNLFAYRSTDPAQLRSVENPVGDENDDYIKKYADLSDKVVACWGNDGTYLGRSEQVKNSLKTLFCLKVNQSGQPCHPLYLKADISLKPYK
ncbi:DUF1643 domain-containing protein [Streptococcus oricebi]|uniref:DUF1643 domain-containing protein n=1 Tax=Streptococcus oricebi TaxID=1547447 RepID=A0ABS5B408_9STRE|nr:DUF1643 domain-containing protein [Streptococcus oricebi]MBP2623208.1 hypothetical protein [Streptococcus oricebi]